MKNFSVETAAVAIMSLAISIGAKADNSPWSLGVGVLNLSSPYIGVDAKSYPLPIINYDGDRLRASIFKVDYDFFAKNKLKISFSTEIVEEFFKPSDSSSQLVNSLDNRKISYYSGAKFTYGLDEGVISFSALCDISGNSKGSILKASYSYPFNITEDLHIIPSITAKYKSSDVSNYYYGTNEYR